VTANICRALGAKKLIADAALGDAHGLRAV
jgi:hypothetical protein